MGLWHGSGGTLNAEQLAPVAPPGPAEEQYAQPADAVAVPAEAGMPQAGLRLREEGRPPPRPPATLTGPGLGAGDGDGAGAGLGAGDGDGAGDGLGAGDGD